MADVDVTITVPDAYVSQVIEMLDFFGGKDIHPLQPLRHRGVVGAVFLHRAVGVDALLEARDVVVLAVTRRGVHEAGAVLEGDVVGRHHRADAIHERVLVVHLPGHQLEAPATTEQLGALVERDVPQVVADDHVPRLTEVTDPHQGVLGGRRHRDRTDA